MALQGSDRFLHADAFNVEAGGAGQERWTCLARDRKDAPQQNRKNQGKTPPSDLNGR
jgi:hypothetical protein